MSSSEERVVVLTFDNSNFEKNTQKSLETLNNLDASIEKAGAANGLTKLSAAANKIDLSGLANNVQSVSDRFSNMGVVGMTVIQNLTNSVVDLGKKAFNQMLSGGWTRAANIEKAKFQIEGLKGVWDETSKGYVEGMKTIKEAVNNAVDSTAYGLDEAAVIGSQLMASGITDANLLEEHLKSVSGLAAMTGGSYADIGRIYAQVAGQGRLMGNQLLQISQRGINVAATMKDYANANLEVRDALLAAAKASGTNTKTIDEMIDRISKGAELTEADIRELVSTGVVSFEFFSAAMGDAFAEHAKDANKTFDGALANMKAALNRIGAEFATPLRDNLRDIFNSVTPVINNIKAALMPFINIVVAAGKKVTAGIVAVLNVIAKATAPVEAAAKTVKKATKQVDKAGKTVKKLSGIITISKREAKAAFDIWNKGTYGNGRARRKALEKEGMSYKHVQGYVSALIKYNFDLDKVHKKIRVSGDKVSKTLEKSSNNTKAATKHTKEYWHHLKILNENEKWRAVVQHKGVETAWKLYQQNQKRIKQEKEEAHRLNIIQAIVIGVKAAIAAIKNVALAVWNVIKTIGVSLKAIFGPIINTLFNLTKAGGGVLLLGIINLTKKLKELTAEGLSKVSSVMDSKVRPAMERFSAKLVDGIHKVKEFFTSNKTLHKVLDSIWTIIKKVGAAIGKFVTSIKDYFKNTKQGKENAKVLKDIWEVIKKLASGALHKVVTDLEKLSKMKISLPDFGDIIGKFKGDGKSNSFLDTLKEKISNIFSIDSVYADTKSDGGVVETGKKLAANLTESSDLIKNATDTLGDASKTASKSLSFIEKTGSKFTEAMTSFDFEKILKGGWDVAKIYALIQGTRAAFKLADKIGGVFGAISDAIAPYAGILSEIRQNIGANMKMKMFKDIAISIGIISVSLYILSKIPVAAAFKAISYIAAIITIFTTSILVMTFKISASIPSLLGLGAAFSLISSSMLILAGAIKLLSIMDAKTITKGIAVIGILMGMFVAASKLVGRIIGGTISFAGMALAIDLLIPALLMLSKMEPETIVRGGTAIMYLMTELAIASRIAKRSVKNAGAILAMAIAVDLLVPAILIMALIPFAKAIKGAFVIGVVLLAVATAAKFAGESKLSSLYAMTAIVTVLSAAIIILAFLPIEKALAAGGMMTSVFLSLSVAIAVANKMKGTEKGMLVIIGIVASIAFLFNMLASLPVDKVLGIGTSISMALISISAAVGILSLVNFEGAGIAVAALAVFCIGMIGVLSLLGEIYESQVVRNLVSNGSKMFGMLGEAIGNFVGSIVSGFGKAVASGLPYMGEQFSTFMDKIGPGLDKLKKLDPDIGTTVKNLASSIALLTGSSFLDSINLFSKDDKISDFGEQLNKFIDSLDYFIESSKDIDDDSADSANRVAKLIKNLAAAADEIPASGGIWQGIAGNTTLEEFAEWLPSVANNLSDAISDLPNVKGGGYGKLERVSEVIKALAKVADDIPPSAGFVQFITGNTTISEFAESIAYSMPKIKKAIDEVGKIKDYKTGSERLISSADVFKALGEAAKVPPPSAGLAHFFTGNTTLDEFAGYIAGAAPSIKKAMDEVSKIPDFENGASRLEAIAPAISALGSAAKKIPEFDWNETTESNDIKTFAEFLSSAMPSIAKAADALSETRIEDIDKLSSFLTSFSELAKIDMEKFDPSKFDGLIKVLMGGNFLGVKYGLGPAIASFCESIKGISTENLEPVSNFIGKFSSLASASTNFDPADFNDIIQVLGGGTINLGPLSVATGLGPAIKNFCDSIAGASTENLKAVSSVVTAVVKAAGKAKGVSYVGLLDLTETLPTLATRLKTFSANLKGFKGEIAKAGADVLVSLSEVVKVFQKFTVTGKRGSSTQASFDENSFDAFTKGLGKLASAVKEFAEDMVGVDVSGLSDKADAIKSFVNSTVRSIKKANKQLKNTGTNGVNNFVKGFNKISDADGLARLPGRISNAIGLYKFKTEGGKAGKKFVEGFEGVKGAKAAGETIRDKFIEGVGNLFDTGMQVGAGFVRGIESKGPSAYGAGAALFAEAKRAIKEKSDQNSPSKVTTKQGENVGEGLVVGMLNYRKLAYRAGEEVAGRMLSGVGDNLSSDFTDPVIKPVLDLSDVKSGANSIGGMFGTTSIRPSLVPMMRNRQNEATNDDLIEAINTMSSNIVQTTNSNRGETYNIGDVTLEVGDLKDVVTLEQLVSVIKKAKAFS